MSQDFVSIVISQLNQVMSSASSMNGEVNSQRLFHGRGKIYKDLSFLTIDLYYPVIHVIYFAAPDEEWQQTFVTELTRFCQQYQLACVIIQRRYQPGSPSSIVWGKLPDQVLALSNGLKFQLQLERNQNVGFFLDMVPGHQWLEPVASGSSILNLFAYTCAFSVVAKRAGAKRIVNIDMSKNALQIGKANHQLNGLSLAGVEFMPYDIFRSLGKLTKKGPFDIVICDPPSYQKGSFIAGKDYARLARRFSQWVKPGGLLLVCLNAPNLNIDFIQAMMRDAAPSFEFVERLKNAATFPDLDHQRSLKLLIYRNSRDNSSS